MRWHDAFRAWLEARFQVFRGAPARFEDVLHKFAATIAAADDAATVESALFRLAHRMAPGSWIEVVPEQVPKSDHGMEGHPDGPKTADRRNQPVGQAVLEVPLRSGASVFGQLRLRSRSGGRRALRSRTIQRLTTICTMAASAMECLGNHATWPPNDDGAQPQRRSTDPCSPNADRAVHPSGAAIPIHDATFLNAVLPFALNQSRRHREPLSILCMAIDQQKSVQDLLGRAEVDRLIQHVGKITGCLIRTSDIVARLDDDRVVAVLPRAPRGGALGVAHKICRAVAESHPPNCSIPSVTVSIGVATFPSCSDNVYSLFDAADEALAWAQNNGRNQAVLAHPHPARAPSQPSAQTAAAMP
jgi:diguanylate cyclase (GGDEF)-like protein